jgi:hypothetical protein
VLSTGTTQDLRAFNADVTEGAGLTRLTRRDPQRAAAVPSRSGTQIGPGTGSPITTRREALRGSERNGRPPTARTHNQVIKAQDRHLKAQVAAGDETHREAHEAMRGRWKRPISGLGWYRDVKREFASLPDDA